MQSESLKLFFSYAHEDEQYRNELEKHLSALRNQGVIEDWHDRKLIAGDELDPEIIQKLESSDIILFLISSDFLHSKYCYKQELIKAIELKNVGRAHLIAIIVRPVDCEGELFTKFVMLPTDAKPVTTWEDRDEAWTNVAKGIRKVCEKKLQEYDLQDPFSAKKREISTHTRDTEIVFKKRNRYGFSVTEERSVLSLRARINFSHEAGSAWLMKVMVNNVVLTEKHLINKPPAKEIQDGRIRPWFGDQNESWRLCYSPNFKENYFHSRYRVVNGDPYLFVFDLSSVRIKHGKYEVIIEHKGVEGIEAYKNSIIIRNVEVI